MLSRVVAALLLAGLSPLFLMVLVAQWLCMGRPLFYVDQRIGHQGKAFPLYKFRSMEGSQVPRFGRFMRTYSIDEWPQLWNIVKGDMHFIGPRPLPLRYATRLSPNEHLRHSVKPGLTGWAQVNGRNEQSWQERFTLDLHYVQQQSIVLDAHILWRTLGIVLRGKGAASEPQHFMEELGEYHNRTVA